MKIAVLSESTADEAAILILIEGLLGTKIDPVSLPAPKTRGWRGTLSAVRPALFHLHYRTDAEAIVVTVDSDESPVHHQGHEQPGGGDLDCRLCQLRAIVTDAQRDLRPRQGCGPVKTALGLAVPTVEAWCIAGTDPHVTESAWIQALQSRSFPYSKRDLKERLYGSVKPTLVLETACLVEQAQRLVAQKQLALLESYFPVGFGSLANEVRSWLL